MGRPPRPIDPATSPIAAFAYDLRALRDSAGTPSYRTLARKTHYSVTTLSQAAAGDALPTLPVLRVYVEGCGGDPDEWEKRWRALAAEVGKPEPIRAEAAPGETARAARSTFQISRRTAAVGAGALALLVAAVVAVFAWPSPAKSGPASAAKLGQPEPIVDGSDPNRAGCGPDAVTLAWTPVGFPAGMNAGKVELRYSPRCAMAWGRFTPDPDWKPGPGVTVTVWTIRPADSASQEFTVTYQNQAIIGNMLKTRLGCVSAEVTMAQGNAVSPVANTPCMRFGPGS